MGRLEIIRQELDTDPLGRGYSGMDDEAAAVDMNTVYRPANVDIARIFKFLVLDEVHSTDGTDTQDRAIWQRMKEVESMVSRATNPPISNVPDIPEVPDKVMSNPWGSSTVGNITEIRQLKTVTLVDYFRITAQGNLGVDTQDSNFQSFVNGAAAAGCMSSAQATALIGLGENQQSRGTELGVGRVGEGTITQARAL